MNKLFIVLAMLAMLSACTLLRRRSKSETVKSSLSTSVLKKEELKISSKESLLLLRDSSRDDSWIEIVPIGMVSYSPNGGFKGQAASIKIRGIRSQQGEALKKEQHSYSLRKLELKATEQAKKQTVKTMDSLTFNTSYYLFLIPVIICVLWLWRRNRLRQRNRP